MSKPKRETQGNQNPHADEPHRFTGVARSVECYDNNGFRNFRLITLHLENGIVVGLERSDAYANFEAISRLELLNEMAVINLNNNWKAGKTLCK